MAGTNQQVLWAVLWLKTEMSCGLLVPFVRSLRDLGEKARVSMINTYSEPGICKDRKASLSPQRASH